MSRAKPSLAWHNVAQHVYRPEPARGVPLAMQAAIVVVVIVALCLLVAAAGNAMGAGR